MRELNMSKITMGICYYPEHWDKSLWADDIKRMKECGIEVIRVAEFAWSIFESNEGEFSFEFFDEFMENILTYQTQRLFLKIRGISTIQSSNSLSLLFINL